MLAIKQYLPLSITCLSVALLAGCSNAVSYHHSERNSIALEVRSTDPQQPIQGIIGVKTRTLLVTPGIADDDVVAEGKPEGESTSVISDFKLQRKESESFFGFGSTSIQSAFITGDAAKNAPASTAKALSGLGSSGAGDEATLQLNVMQDVYRFLDLRKAKDPIAKQHVEQLDNLAKLLPKDYAKQTYYDISGGVLMKKDTSTYTPKPDGFLEALDYEHSFLDGSIASIETMEKDRTIKYLATAAGTPADITVTDLTMFQTELKRLKAEKRSFFDMIGNHNAIDSAAAYMISTL